MWGSPCTLGETVATRQSRESVGSKGHFYRLGTRCCSLGSCGWLGCRPLSARPLGRLGGPGPGLPLRSPSFKVLGGSCYPDQKLAVGITPRWVGQQEPCGWRGATLQPPAPHPSVGTSSRLSPAVGVGSGQLGASLCQPQEVTFAALLSLPCAAAAPGLSAANPLAACRQS